MECPYCKQLVGRFSRSMNRFGKVKACPHCCKPVRLAVSPVHVAMFFIPGVLVAVLLRPWLGAFATGLAVAVTLALSMRLKPAG